MEVLKNTANILEKPKWNNWVTMIKQIISKENIKREKQRWSKEIKMAGVIRGGTRK